MHSNIPGEGRAGDRLTLLGLTPDLLSRVRIGPSYAEGDRKILAKIIYALIDELQYNHCVFEAPSTYPLLKIINDNSLVVRVLEDNNAKESK